MPEAANRVPFHVMVKPSGPRCNLDCSYCFYLSKTGLYPEERKFRMNDAVLETYIRDHIAAHVALGVPEVGFTWQGGEPTLLGLPFFERVLELQRQYAPPGFRISNSIQTNGTLLDTDWAAFLARNSFLVGLSLDGPKALHDRYRIDRAGRPSFDAVMRGLDLLRQHKVDTNLLCVVHSHNVLKPKEVYRFLRGQGEFLQFIPLVDPGPDGQASPQSLRPAAFGKFLCEVFDLWVQHDVGRVFVQFFDEQLRLWMGHPASLCVFAETCGPALALEQNGDLYACDHFVTPEHRLGNIMQTSMADMAWSQRQRAFGAAKADLPPQCVACSHHFACNGGCPKDRIGPGGVNYLCAAYKAFFQHAGPKLWQMAALVAKGQPAAQIMRR
ncbi:anaerobic sulfatase maturase [Rhodobacter ferrooxidans]|uniref:Radical SAM domain protein n=1 Tax=Rhodobacter ferrooxidans TaxID=371731 RepID=C8RZH8_9RHOB|nr:anaerobic sulfatase maturase [Rhodobacter sp. SW2]EEW25775.1 Radical SAM domain protein [Rhodobacter sp. SW2]